MDNKKKSLLKCASFQDAIFVFLCTGALLAYSLYHQFHDKNIRNWKTSPYLFPVLLCSFGLLLALSLVADALRERKTAPEAVGEKKGSMLVKVLVTIAIAFAYYYLLPVLHFIPATILFLLGLMVFYGVRKWYVLLLVSAITSGAIYALFGMALHVRLP